MSRKDRAEFEALLADVRANETLRQHICAWLETNSVDPGHIPIDAGMTFTGDRLTTTVYQRDAEGRHFLDPDRPNETAKEVATYTVTVPPPEDVAAWLANRWAP